MRRLPVVTATVAIVAAAFSVAATGAGASLTPSAPSTPSPASAVAQARAARACGTFRSSGHTLGVTVSRGNTNCAEARKVLSEFVNGTSTLHPAGRNTYWTVGSWRCLPTSNGGACTRGGTNPRTARESIAAAIK